MVNVHIINPKIRQPMNQHEIPVYLGTTFHEINDYIN